MRDVSNQSAPEQGCGGDRKGEREVVSEFGSRESACAGTTVTLLIEKALTASVIQGRYRMD